MKKPIQVILSVSLFWALLLLTGCWHIPGNSTPPAIRDGLLDLREWDFSRDGIVDLSGPWRFHWNRLLPPDSDFSSFSENDYRLLKVPGAWNGLKLNGTPLPGDGFGTYQLRILVSPENKHLALKILDFSSASKLFINGSLKYQSGITGTEPNASKPYVLPKVASYTIDATKIDLLVHISNYHHRLGGMRKSIKIGDESQIRNQLERNHWINFFLLGCILIMGLYHIGLYWNWRADKTSLLFGIFCILMGIRLLTTGQRYILHMAPGLSFEHLYKIIYISFYLCVPVFTAYVRNLFPGEISKKAVTISLAAGLSLFLLVLLTPLKIYSHTMLGFELFTVLLFGYGIVGVIVASKRGRSESIVFLSGFLVLFICVANDILYSRQVINTGHFFHLGFFIFLFSQAHIISKRFSRAFSTIEEQRQKLESVNTGYEEELEKRKQAQIELMVSEKKYRLLADNVSDTIWVFDLATNKLDYISPSVLKNRGYTPEEALSQGLEGTFSQESYERVMQIMQEEFDREKLAGVSKQRSRTFEAEQTIKGGGHIWVEITATFIRDKQGNPTGVMGVTRDIEARKKAESALIESEKKYRNLFENGSDLLYIHDLDGNLIETNFHYKKQYGWTKEALSNANLRNILSSKYHNELDPYMEHVLKHGSVEGYFRGKTSSGQEVILEYRNNLITDSNGVAIAVQGAARDVTEKFKAERAMRESEKRYRSVFEKSTDAIFIVNKKTGKYVDANESGIQLTGRSRSELRQLTTQDVVPSGALEHLKSVDESKTNVDFGKVTYVRPDGSQRIALLSSLPIDRENVMGIARDITEELALAEKLRQTQKMEAIGTLAGGIAHDFNNILSAILGYSELILTELPSESSIKNKIEAICNAGERARDLVSQILTFSRKDEQVKLPVELRAIIRDALKILRPAIPTTIDIQTQLNSKGRILADPSRIHQVIMNLCTNASQAMLATGGTLAITLADTKLEGDAAAKAQIPPGNYVELKLSDTGTGIPPENIERIFDPFFTTKEVGHGTGLGLSVVHGIINRHMGAVLVESEIGKGTQFKVYLPLSTEENDIETPQIELTTGGSERILLVDDEQDILEIEKQMLEKLGYLVTATNNPLVALELFANQPGQFDLVITDMTMPTLTGDKLVVEFHKIIPNIPTIICTGYSELMSKEKAASLGINEFLMKPIKMVDLSTTIRSVLDKTKN